MKKALFWVTMLPLVVVTVFIGFLESIALLIHCFGEVLHILLLRYEHWAFNVPKGTFMNCPWRSSLKEIWLKEYRGM